VLVSRTLHVTFYFLHVTAKCIFPWGYIIIHTNRESELSKEKERERERERGRGKVSRAVEASGLVKGERERERE
jgi:hypothetical protein